MKRRTMIGLLGGAVLSMVASPSLVAYAQEDSNNMARAIASYDALQKYFYETDGSYLYHEQYPVASGDNHYSYEWPFSQAHTATIDLTNLPGDTGRSFYGALQDRWLGQERYWNTTGATGLPGYDSYARPPYGNGGDKFYDDNEWVGLAYIQLYMMTGEQKAFDRAKQIFSLVVSGWDTNSTHADPGGVFWTQASWSHDRNTGSNMAGAELGLRLYQLIGDQYYFDWAQKMYDWTNTYLLAPNGLYWDHIDLAGNVQKTQWSYNQGVPVGVNTLFYEVTGDRIYLQRAQNIANAALDFYGTNNQLYQQPDYFNSIFFKNLLLLQSVDHDQRYVKAMQAYADQVWQTSRDSATGLFHFNGWSETQMVEQAAMTQIYAVLAWSPSQGIVNLRKGGKPWHAESMNTQTSSSPYKGYRFPPEIISHAVWLYFRFSLSFRDVEELLAQRRIVVSYETVRQWCLKFGQTYANGLRRRCPRCSDTWHLDEVSLKINGKTHYLWRAVDQDGNVLDILVQSRYNKHAAKKFFRKLLKGLQYVPRVIITDTLKSYGAAKREILPGVEHRQHKDLNNRAENSHQPTRSREKNMRRFKSAKHAQCFLSAFGRISGHFQPRRYRLTDRWRKWQSRCINPKCSLARQWTFTVTGLITQSLVTHSKR